METNLTKSQLKQVVLAMGYGDAYVDFNHNSGKARLDIYHCVAQLEYILWKQGVLCQIPGVKVTVSEKIDKRKLVGGDTRKGYRLQTTFSRYFYSLMHSTPLKFRVKQLVKPLALSVLWQDDGTLCIHKEGHYSSAVLCTDSWDSKFLAQFRERFNKEYGWTMIPLAASCRGVVYHRLRMRKAMMLDFSEIVSPFVCDVMQYKLLGS